MSFSPFLWGEGEAAVDVGTVQALRGAGLAGGGAIHLFAVEKYNIFMNYWIFKSSSNVDQKKRI